MAFGCGAKMAKFVLFVFNVLFWLSGLILIIVGAVLLSNGSMKYIDEVVNSSTNRNILILFIVVGVIIFAIGFCGCCGAIKENKCLLGSYILFLFIIIILEVAFGIFAIVNKSTVQKQFTDSFNNTLMTKYGDMTNRTKADPTVIVTIDNLQQLFKCCGVSSYSDWLNSVWMQYQSNKIQTFPVSCCVLKDYPCWTNISEVTTFTEGCVSKINKYIKNNLPIVIGVSLGIAFFEIFVVICAFCLCRNTDDQRQAV